MTGQEYKALRERLALTQGELASRLGVTRKTINARENGAKITEEAALAIRSLAGHEFKTGSYSEWADELKGVEYSSFRKAVLHAQGSDIVPTGRSAEAKGREILGDHIGDWKG
jgi:DNA-binding XRE family transcriptional regulator